MIDLMGTQLGAMLNRSRSVGPEYLWVKIFSDKELQRYIIDVLIQDEQLQKGKDGTGNRITDTRGNDSYAKLTEILSNGVKKAGDPYTLEDTGYFYDSMIIRVFRKEIEIDADPIKQTSDTNLFSKYGEEIIGLTKQSKTKLVKILKERYNSELLKLLHGIR